MYRKELEDWQMSESAAALRVRLTESEQRRHELELVGSLRAGRAIRLRLSSKRLFVHCVQEYEQLKEHSQKLLASERQLNERLRKLLS